MVLLLCSSEVWLQESVPVAYVVVVVVVAPLLPPPQDHPLQFDPESS